MKRQVKTAEKITKSSTLQAFAILGSRRLYPGNFGMKKSPGSRDFGIPGFPDEGPPPDIFHTYEGAV